MSTTVVHDSPTTERGTGQLGLRLEVLTHRSSLDRRLAEGAVPDSDPALQLRAEQLTSDRSRRRLARSLSLASKRIARPSVYSSAAPLDRRAVAKAQPQLTELAHRLEGTAPVGVRGVAMVHELLVDGSSPMYSHGGNGKPSESVLSDRLSAATRALDTH